MKAHTAISDSTSNTYLAGTILFANIDYSGFGGYALKAAIGGFIWMAFKLAGDYLSQKMLERKKSKNFTKEKDDTTTNEVDKED